MGARVQEHRSQRSHFALALISTLGIAIGFCIILVCQYLSHNPMKLFEVDSKFIPFGYASTNLLFPGVEFNSRPHGFLSAVDLSQPLPIPQHHDVTAIGEHARYELHIVSEGRIQNMPDSFVLMHFENALFLSEAVLIQNNKYVLMTRACHPRYWEQFWQRPVNVTYNYPMYESAICLGHQHSSDFGHWFLEVLPAYAVLPSDIVMNSIVVVPEKHDHVVDGFAFLGVKEYQIVVGINIPIFARHFYTVDYMFCGDLVRFLIATLTKLFQERFNLGKVQPTKYVLYNRWNMSRAIGNFKELMEATKAKWPQIPWQECPHVKTIKAQAKYFDEVTFLFGVHGSVLANIIFMRPDTAVVDLQMEQWLLSFLWLSAYTGKYMVVGRDPRITWRGKTPNIVDTRYVLELFEKALTHIKAI